MNQHKAHILGATAFLLLPIAALAPKGVAPLFGVAALILVVLHAVEYRRWPRLPRGGATLAFALFVAVALFSVFWSPTPEVSLRHGLSFAVTVFAGLTIVGVAGQLDARGIKTVRYWVLFGGAASWMFLLGEMMGDATLTRWLLGLFGKTLPKSNATAYLNAGLAVAAAYVWIWIYTIRVRFSLAAAAAGFALTLFVLAQSEADSALVAVVAAMAAFSLGAFLPKRAPAIAAGVIALGIIFAPFIPFVFPDPLTDNPLTTRMSHSAQHRLYIWRNVAEKVAEHPVIGHGFDTVRSFYGDEDKVWVRFGGENPDLFWHNWFEPIPLHPHNIALQVWAELGALGAGAYLAVLLVILAQVARSLAGRMARASAIATFTAVLTMALISFGAWQSWWMAAQWLIAATAVAIMRDDVDLPEDPHRGQA